MNILFWILFGALAGWVASIAMKTEATHGAITDILLGIVGAVVGGVLMNAVGQSGVTGFNLYSLLIAIGGAMVVIYIGRIIRSRT
jgi:uncharacterized membrane protein YeaQ/YmgE (transglycosylase-associated protein family)